MAQTKVSFVHNLCNRSSTIRLQRNTLTFSRTLPVFLQTNRSNIQLICPYSSIAKWTHILQIHHRKHEDQVPNLGIDIEKIHQIEKFALWKPHCAHVEERQYMVPLHDYCTLKKNTVKNCYPITRIEYLLDLLRGRKYFTKIDPKIGYHQVLVDLQMFGKLHSRQRMVYMNGWK